MNDFEKSRVSEGTEAESSEPCLYRSCQECAAHDQSVFADMSSVRLRTISEQVKAREYDRGESLYQEGDEAQGLYCIQHGIFKLTRKAGVEGGREQVVRLIKPGDILGYSALMQGKKALFSAVAVEKSAACFIPGEIFRRQLERSPELLSEFLARVCKDLDGVEQALAQVASGSVRERVAYTLWNLAEVYGVKENEGIRIDVRLSRSELASLAGTVTETFVRCLTDFKTEGLVNLRGRMIVLRDPDRIRNCFAQRPVAQVSSSTAPTSL